MNEELSALLLLRDMTENNQKKILADLNSFLIESTQDLYDFNVTFEDAGLLEKLLIQIIFHNSSLMNLTEGSKIPIRDKTLQIKDLTAVYSIARLQIDSFINLSYLFFMESEYPQNLRVYVYKIHGLRRQLLLNKKHPKRSNQILKIRRELAEEIRKLRTTRRYLDASFKEREKFVEPKYAKLLKSEEVLKVQEFYNLERLYSLYSNHIHGEYIGIRQLNSSLKEQNVFENNIASVLQTCCLITSSTIMNLVSKFGIENGYYSKAPSILKKIVEVQCKISKNLRMTT
ncbi:MAG: hypothetical protein ABGX00_14580 [Allomuricauda sp.]